MSRKAILNKDEKISRRKNEVVALVVDVTSSQEKT